LLKCNLDGREGILWGSELLEEVESASNNLKLTVCAGMIGGAPWAKRSSALSFLILQKTAGLCALGEETGLRAQEKKMRS
jgi:hypothetical protein